MDRTKLVMLDFMQNAKFFPEKPFGANDTQINYFYNPYASDLTKNLTNLKYLTNLI